MNALLKTLDLNLDSNIQTTAIQTVDDLTYYLDRLGINLSDDSIQKITENIILEIHNHINNV